ncbi:MAG: hypothetical protein ACKVT2_07315 [Saprospiraceae bacterium]
MQTPPSFDSWTIVFLIAAVQGFFTAFVLTKWRRGHPLANRLLAWMLILFSITLVEYVLYWTGYLFHFPHMANVSIQFPFLYGPILWLYLRTIYEGKPLKKQDWWLFAPFILGVFCFAESYLADTATKQAVLSGDLPFRGEIWMLKFQFWARMVWILGFALWNLA